MLYICAPDSFKGTFSADEVATALATGVRAADAAAVIQPMADGGEGTASVLASVYGAKPVSRMVHDPLGRAISATWWRSGQTAIVEMAQASGLTLVAPAERDAVAASTGGTGELVANAIACGCKTILVTVGGSATTDGGAGAIVAIQDAGGVPDDVQIIILSDVSTVFEDAPRIFGPQKGASRAEVAALEHRLDNLARSLPIDPRGVSATGAGGGISGGLWAQFGAKLVSGIDELIEVTGLESLITQADEPVTIISGEGRFDSQTPAGKVIAGLAALAQRTRARIDVVAGSLGDGADQAQHQLGVATLTTATDLDSISAAAERLVQRDQAQK